MDNLSTPIPSVPPQPAVEPEVSTPAESPNRRWFLWLIGGLAILALGIAIGAFGAKFFNQSTTESQISSYQDCLAAKGSIVQESYPATCVTVSGQRFVQPLTDEEKQSLQPPDLYREPAGSAATTNWQMYTNIKYNYSIKYPLTLKTQILAAGAGNKEASANSDHIFIYNSSSQEPYLERYIEIQPFGQATSYGPEWQRFDIEINGISVAKFTNPDQNTFIIYRVAIPNTPGELEIMVTKDSRRSALADQILSTFHFLK